MYKIIISNNAQSQIKKLTTEAQKRIESSLDRIKIRPHAFLKKLVSLPLYAMKVGKYRIIARIFENKLIILVVKVAHRKNVYKKLEK